MTKISFKVSARTARLIGRENVGTAQAAIIELVKNSYDADAELVNLIFDDGRLIIADSGVGMSLDKIENYWMTIGTDNKDSAPISESGRVKSGAKGIGRFSLDKLGDEVEMFTRTDDNGPAFKWSMNWRLFEQRGVNLDNITAELEEISAKEFELELERFGIYHTKHGSIFKISHLRDQWQEYELDDLYNALESLVPEIDNDKFLINMISDGYPDKYGEVKPMVVNEFDYKIQSHFSQQERKIKLRIHRHELDVEKLKGKFQGVFQQHNMQKPEYQLEAFERGYIEKEISLNSLLGNKIDEDVIKHIGDFDFDFIFIKNQLSGADKKKNPFLTIDYGTRSEWLKRFGGVRIYRDNFKVRPYGEQGNDWLGLGERQAKSPQGAGQRIGAYRIRPNQIVGSVKISRIDSIGLQDKSSREGIQEDASFRLLKSILIEIINQFEIDRNVVQYSIAQEYKIINSAAASKDDGEKALKNVQSGGSEQSDDNIQNANALASYVVTLKDENQDQKEEIRILRSLASSGLVTAAAAHELWGYRNQLTTRAGNMRNAISKHLDEKQLDETNRIYNPFVHIDSMENTDRHIVGWLNYALKPIRKDRRSAKKVFVDSYLSSLHESWDYLLESKKAVLKIGVIPPNTAIQMYPIDLDSIFNNLIVNSLDSFLQSKRAGVRQITIDAHRASDMIVITYQDSGDGLPAEFLDDPEQIFLPHVTSKRNSRTGEVIGTGMGMYIVKMIIDECQGDIKVVNAKNGFSVEISFKVVR